MWKHESGKIEAVMTIRNPTAATIVVSHVQVVSPRGCLIEGRVPAKPAAVKRKTKLSA